MADLLAQLAQWDEPTPQQSLSGQALFWVTLLVLFASIHGAQALRAILSKRQPRRPKMVHEVEKPLEYGFGAGYKQRQAAAGFHSDPTGYRSPTEEEQNKTADDTWKAGMEVQA
eukprot:Sspe_Gene.84323::Locus_55349_Transcript_1_1_Confidence_1.000_Length_378::g.84323::m.84323